MTFTGQKENKIDKTYTQDRIKQSQIHYQANELTCTFTNKEKKNINIIFRVSNNDIAFRYEMPKYGDTGSIVIEKKLPVLTSPPSPLLSCARKVTP
jgi:Glycoside hydrolase 97.